MVPMDRSNVEQGDYSDMVAAIRQSAAAPSLEKLRPHFADWRAQMVANGCPRVPPSLSLSGVQDDMATNMFILLVKQASERKLRQQRVNAAEEHNLRNILTYMRIPMFRRRGSWKP
jgi:uncharacterized protein YcbX